MKGLLDERVVAFSVFSTLEFVLNLDHGNHAAIPLLLLLLLSHTITLCVPVAYERHTWARAPGVLDIDGKNSLM